MLLPSELWCAREEYSFSLDVKQTGFEVIQVTNSPPFANGEVGFPPQHQSLLSRNALFPLLITGFDIECAATFAGQYFLLRAAEYQHAHFFQNIEGKKEMTQVIGGLGEAIAICVTYHVFGTTVIRSFQTTQTTKCADYYFELDGGRYALEVKSGKTSHKSKSFKKAVNQCISSISNQMHLNPNVHLCYVLQCVNRGDVDPGPHVTLTEVGLVWV